ncbi:MAG: YIP1 family protein [Bacillota bacterium]
MGTAARIVGMVVNPLRTLDDIVRRPRALTAASLLLGTNLLFVLLIWDKIHQHARWLVEHAPPPEVPAEELTRFADQAPAVASTDALLGPAITWFMIALLIRILATGAGRTVTFGLLFNVAVFGMVPHMLGLYLDSVVRYFADPERLDYLQLGINAAYLVPGGVDSKWSPLLNAVNPFTIWGLALASIGGAKLLEVKVARVAVPLLGLWFLLALIRTFSPSGAAG